MTASQNLILKNNSKLPQSNLKNKSKIKFNQSNKSKDNIKSNKKDIDWSTSSPIKFETSIPKLLGNKATKHIASDMSPAFTFNSKLLKDSSKLKSLLICEQDTERIIKEVNLITKTSCNPQSKSFNNINFQTYTNKENIIKLSSSNDFKNQSNYYQINKNNEFTNNSQNNQLFTPINFERSKIYIYFNFLLNNNYKFLIDTLKYF